MILAPLSMPPPCTNCKLSIGCFRTVSRSCKFHRMFRASRSRRRPPRGASQCLAMMGHTSAHRNHHNLTGSSCTTHLHSFRRNCLPTCSNLEQAQAWEVPSSGSAAAPESVEVLVSVQLLSALELVR